MWSFGLIAFWMLTGKIYWLNANVADDELNVYALLGEIAGKDVIAPATDRLRVLGGTRPSLPPEFDAWFARCVNRDVNARFASAREAVDELITALRDAGGGGQTRLSLPLIPHGLTQPVDGERIGHPTVQGVRSPRRSPPNRTSSRSRRRCDQRVQGLQLPMRVIIFM